MLSFAIMEIFKSNVFQNLLYQAWLLGIIAIIQH